MQIELDSSLQRWTDAHLIEAGQAARIREFEIGAAPAQRARLPIVIGLVLGGIMLAAGVLLFVSAHWEELSPAQRMTLLVCAVGGSHLAAAFCTERFHAMAVTLHAVGTVVLGGAIFLAGQIFNMEEHWPTGILLWAIGAIAGWGFLKQWPQLAFAAILTPFWLIGEWTEAASGLAGMFQIVAVGSALLAICYLTVPQTQNTARVFSRVFVSRVYVWLGGLALLPSVLAVALATWSESRQTDPARLLTIGWAGAILIPLAFAWVYRRNQAWMNGVAAAWVVGLSWMPAQRFEPLLYVWCLAGCVGLIAWGIYEMRSERVNLGMAGFALTVIFFFFSSVMDKLGRSTSLILLGVAFLGGGWYWEKLRRRLVARAQAGGAQ
jgi:uncharacterized membrane protein